MEDKKNVFAKLKENFLKHKALCIAIAAVLVAAVVVIVCCVSCGSEEAPDETQGTTGTTAPQIPLDEGELAYSVTVVDALGNPWGSDVIVNFMQDGASAGMQTLDETGVAVKALTAGEYTVELSFIDGDKIYHYDPVVLTADSTSAQIVLTYGTAEEGKELFVDGVAYDAHYIGNGCTYVELASEGRTYLIYLPTESGLYRYSIAGAQLTFGYYGSTFFVQDTMLHELNEDGSFEVSISPSYIGEDGSSAAMVLGIDGDGAENCIVCIERIGDHILTVEDYLWDIYEATVELSKFTLPEGTTLVDFDVTASTDAYNLVFNSADGYYHLDSEDGPVVYLKLGVDSPWLDSFKKILDCSPICKYYYDENGEFVSKESYTECMLEYISYMDEDSGLYPLTEDLKYIIQSRGDFVGWWIVDSGTFIFNDENGNPIVGLNTEIAWLFACCYGQVEEVVEDPADEPDANTDNSGTTNNNGGTTNNNGGTTNNGGSSNKDDNSNDSGKEEQKDPEPTEGTCANPGEPITLGGEAALNFDIEIPAGQYVDYCLYKVSGTILKIESKNAYIIYNGETYWPKDGVVKVSLHSDSPSVPMEFSIGNIGSDTLKYSVKLTYPVGTWSNPASLSLGQTSIKTTSGDEDGYVYNYTAPSAGTFTITLDSISIDESCAVSIQSKETSVQVSVTELGESVSLDVSAGEVLIITVSVTDENYQYPAATIKFTAALD